MLSAKYILIIIFGIAITGAGAYYAQNTTENGQDTQSEQEMQSTQQAEEQKKATVSPKEESAFEGTMADLLERGGEYRCSFSHTQDGAHTNGVVYIDGDDRLRGDFESSSQYISFDSHMIVRDGFIYAWTSITPEGIKAPYEAYANAEADPSNTQLQTTYEYDCVSRKPEDHRFVLPDLRFVEAMI